MERLSMSESLKYKTIKELVENKINRERAEVILGLKKRRINQLIVIYKIEGENGFKHGNAGKVPANKIPLDIDVSYTHLYNLWMSKFDPSKEAH